jgi:hypothetical protein
MHVCGLCRKEIPDFSISSIERLTGRHFHVDCANQIRMIIRRRQKKKKKILLNP